MGTKSTRKKVIKKTKTDLEFEKAKRNVKMIGIIATIFLLFLVVIGFFLFNNSYAAMGTEPLPDKFTSSTGTNQKCTNGEIGATCIMLEEIGTIDIPFSFKANYNDTNENLYCIEHKKDFSGGLTYTKDKSVLGSYPGISYILNNASFDLTGGTCLNPPTLPGKVPMYCTEEQLNQYLTQIAIWWYVDKVNGCDDDKNYDSKGVISSIVEDEDGTGKYDSDTRYQYYNNLSALDKKAIKESRYANQITSLVNKALETQSDNTTDNISLPSVNNVKFTVDGSNLVTTPITPTSTSNSFSSYVVTTDNSNVKVLNINKVEQTKFGKGESFVLSVPVSLVKDGKISINVSAEGTFSKQDAYFYVPDDNRAQTTVLGRINYSTSKASLNLNYEVELGEGKFRKVDAETGDYVQGATLVVTDSKGTTVSSFETGDKETVITLPVGNYTVTETKIPDGYSAEKTTYEFEIKKDETTEIVLKNTKLIDVPNTKLNMTYVYGVGAAVVVVGIIFIVIASKSSNGKKKKN